MQQKLIAPTAEKYLSGVALNADSSEETTAVQNAGSLVLSKSLVDSLLPFLGQRELFKLIDVSWFFWSRLFFVLLSDYS